MRFPNSANYLKKKKRKALNFALVKISDPGTNTEKGNTGEDFLPVNLEQWAQDYRKG